jgi:plastocyanin
MRRLLTILVALAAAAATLIVVTGSAAVAKSSNCGTGMSNKNTDDMDMGHGKQSMERNCPVVAGARKIEVTANDFSFSPAQITIAAGENVTIALTASDIAHDFYVKGIGHLVHAKAGKTAQGGLRIKKAGTYKFWCTILGHKKQGMTGTITVTA